MTELRYVGVKNRTLRDLARLYLASARGGRQRRAEFDGVRTFCMFVGYPRSGHSLVGSLLDAHRNAVIGHEMDVLRFLGRGFGRRQLFHLLVENARQFSEGGRQWTDYTYDVPGQWQGRFESLQVIGDKKGGRSTRRLDADPGLLDRFRAEVRVPLRMVHVVRNPFDNIATRFRRNEKLDLATSAERHFELVEAVAALKRRVAQDEMIDVRHEDLIADTPGTLRRICEFLDLDAPAEYLDACDGIVFSAPRRSRSQTQWPADLVERIRERASAYPFLEGYGFSDA